MDGKKLGIPTAYSANNTCHLVRGGSPYFEVLEELIDHAKFSIHLQVYIYEGDQTGGRVADALIRAAERGVQVFMLVDRYASRALPRTTISSIANAGINFRWFESLIHGRNFYIGRRMHHKVVVVDGYKSLVGGINISNNYNDVGEIPGWLDWAVLTEGEASAAVYQRCTQMWFRITNRPIPRFPIPPHATGGNCKVRIRINDWVRNKNQISKSYLEMFRRATNTITIMSSYFLPGRVFRKNLRYATGRGVRVRIIVTKISDVTLAKFAERFFYPWLLERNIEVYEYREKVLHAKIATYDSSWVTIGSYNVNDLSAYASIELNVDVDNPGFASQVDYALQTIINRDCDPINRETLSQKNTIFNRIVYRVAFWLFRAVFFLFTFYFRQEKLQ
jgi:cardiolipin synthase